MPMWKPLKRPLAPMLALVALSCSTGDSDTAPLLARVENQTMTLESIYEQSGINFWSLGESTERWIDEQVLLNHASALSPADRRRFSRTLEAHQQLIRAQMVLDSLIRQRMQITDDDIGAYYEANAPDFQFTDDAAEVIHIGFLQLDAAHAAFESLGPGPPPADSLLNPYNYDHRLVYAQRLIPELDQAIFTPSVNRLQGPVESEYGYHLFWVVRRFSAGQLIPLELVQTQIINHLFQQQLPLVRTAVLDSLREVTDVEIYPN